MSSLDFGFRWLLGTYCRRVMPDQAGNLTYTLVDFAAFGCGHRSWR
jgi:hypothetical protein